MKNDETMNIIQELLLLLLESQRDKISIDLGRV
jgi:hypothetical protein